MLKHGDKAYTRREIADAIDANPETVGTNLIRLKERDPVRHGEPYWVLTDDRKHAVTYVNTTYGEALSEDVNQSQQPTDTDTPSGDNNESPLSVERITQPHREAAETFVERLRARLDDAIDACCLFGSVTRNDATVDNDVDVLVVIANHPDYATVDDQLLDLVDDVQLEYEVRVEVHSIRAESSPHGRNETIRSSEPLSKTARLLPDDDRGDIPRETIDEELERAERASAGTDYPCEHCAAALDAFKRRE